MTPVKFPEANRCLVAPADLEEGVICSALWVRTDENICVSLWRPNWKERLSVLFFGKVWLYVFSGGTQVPACIEARRTF